MGHRFAKPKRGAATGSIEPFACLYPTVVLAIRAAWSLRVDSPVSFARTRPTITCKGDPPMCGTFYRGNRMGMPISFIPRRKKQRGRDQQRQKEKKNEGVEKKRKPGSRSSCGLPIKLHYCLRAALASRYCNPMYGDCSSGEDFMKTARKLVRGCMYGNGLTTVSNVAVGEILKGFALEANPTTRWWM